MEKNQLLAGVLLALSSCAQAGADDSLFEFYGKLYPEWKVQVFDMPSGRGDLVGTMGTLRNDRTRLTKDATDKPDTRDHAWSNSYIGAKGQWSGQALSLGYDVQFVVDPQGEDSMFYNLRENFILRDAFVYAESPLLGQVALGKMDSIYKEWGDRGRMFGITSGNFISTARLISSVAWRGGGDTSFHNRRNYMGAWYSPVLAGWQAGLTHSYKEDLDGPGGPDTTLTAAAVRWQEGAWYAALATEIHRGWLPLSRGVSSPAASSIQNDADSTTSRDQAWRLSLGWKKSAWKVSGDVARLSYNERGESDLPGKFRSYENFSWQIALEYKLSDSFSLGFNHVQSSRGECALTGGLACSTAGLGGNQTALGAFYAVNRELGLFLITAQTHNAPGSRYASAPQGAEVWTGAIGVKYQFGQ